MAERHGGVEKVRIDLTTEQRTQVRKATGRDSVAIELTVEELEERIAPSGIATEGRLASNHNETLLSERRA